MNRIYLDHNSTTPIHPNVAQAILETHLEQFANPASQHQSGQRARRKLESVRTRILQLVDARTQGMNADRLIFTSGGTESNNLAISGLTGPDPGRVLVSSVEHPSIFGPAEKLAQAEFDVVSIPVNDQGECDIERFRSLVSADTRLVSVMLANNETGVIQPVQELAKICADLGVPIHCDATQAIGKLSVSFQDLGVDAMTFSPHKFYGPRGIGGLVLKTGLAPNPIVLGGFQQMGIRPGTEDIALAVGFLTALELWAPDSNSNFCVRYLETARLRDQLERGLVDHSGAVVNGDRAQRLVHTSNLSFPGINRQAFLMAADIAGLDLSTGSACASGSSEPSPVLVAMGLPDEIIESSIRISLGIDNTESEINDAIARMGQIVQNLRGNK